MYNIERFISTVLVGKNPVFLEQKDREDLPILIENVKIELIGYVDSIMDGESYEFEFILPHRYPRIYHRAGESTNQEIMVFPFMSVTKNLYERLIENVNNPVEDVAGWLSGSMNCLRGILTAEGFPEGAVIDDKVIETYGLYDLIGLHDCESIYSDVNKIFRREGLYDWKDVKVQAAECSTYGGCY